MDKRVELDNLLDFFYKYYQNIYMVHLLNMLYEYHIHPPRSYHLDMILTQQDTFGMQGNFQLNLYRSYPNILLAYLLGKLFP